MNELLAAQADTVVVPSLYEDSTILSRFSFVQVYNNRMEPLHKEGDTVIVDIEHTNPTGGGVFAVNSKGASIIGANVARCDNYGSKGIGITLDQDTDGHILFIPIDEFREYVIGRVVGEINTQLISSKPLAL